MANELKVNRWVTLDPTVVDDTDSIYTYYGYAAPNSDAAALTSCSILRINNDTSLREWAEGDPFDFSQAWADRDTDLNYAVRNTT
jgi:hypothetical protein